MSKSFHWKFKISIHPNEQVLELNEESKLCENTWGVLDILDDKETTTEDNNETKVSL